MILANLPSFMAQMPRLPGLMVLECGTNDIGHAGATATFEAITGDWTAMARYLNGRGVRTIFVPILPRAAGFSALFTVTQFELMERCNRWLNGLAQRSEGWVAVASACLPALADPALAGA